MTGFGVKLQDVEGEFLSEAHNEWYVMRRSTLLRIHSDCIRLSPAAQHRCTVANTMERRGLVTREVSYRFRMDGEPVLAQPLVLTSDGVRALNVWNAQRDEVYEP